MWHQLDQIVPVIPDSVLDPTTSPNQTRSPSRVIPSIGPGSIAELSPPRVHVERVSHDARQINLSDINQLLRPVQSASFSLRNLARSWQDVIRMRNSCSNLSSNSSQVTQQMSNLTLRSRREYNRRNLTDDTSRAAPDNIIQPTSNGGHTDRQTATTSSNGSSGTSTPTTSTPSNDYARFFNRLYRSALLRSSQNRMQQMQNIQSAVNIQNMLPTQSLNNNTVTAIAQRRDTVPSRAIDTVTPRDQNRDAQQLIRAFTEMFVRNRIVPAIRTNLREFNGIITDDLANKWCEWMVREQHQHQLVQTIFIRSRSSAIEKVLEFLRQCGVQTQTNIHVTKIRRNQTLHLVVVLSHILHSTGYSNSYFY